MTKAFKKLREEVRARPRAAEEIEAGKEAIKEAMRLAELRDQLDATQVELAKLMHTTQANVSRIERSSNPHLSTLAEYIGALGGRLEINAVFDDRVIPVAAIEDRDAFPKRRR